MYQYKKPNQSDCLTNYKLGVSPKSYKNGLLCGEIHRANNCTSSAPALEKALKNLKETFLKNGYPKNLIDSKIEEIRDRDFGPSDRKLKRDSERNDPELKHVTISLPFTSFRCSVVASKIYKILKKYTPKFRLNIVFSTIKLSSLILPRLKPRTEQFLTSNLVYKFQCDCSSTYIGHTKRIFEHRIFQHRTDTTSHINQHITNCHVYNQNLFENFGSAPSGTVKRQYIKDHFTIMEKNLYNYHSRTRHEGLVITLENPDLNKQVFHKKMTFVCKCANYKIENAVGT